ncbi:Uncharacterised protein [Klebsiella pneumoniae subsp. pneumoniae]|nr:Uncharacterised protein [Klebsiella pneumoniae subsp. pneumoniae]
MRVASDVDLDFRLPTGQYIALELGGMLMANV